MKIVQINVTCGVGSTGKICTGISLILNSIGIENYVLYASDSNGYNRGIKTCNKLYIKFQALKTRMNGKYGFNSKSVTKKILQELDRIKPDIIHLHNIHGHNCNLGMILRYAKINSIKVCWTFHDCWAFTAYCPHFVVNDCNKWKTECNNCIEYRKYSWIFDKSKSLYSMKRKAIENVDLTIVTPSLWLKNLALDSIYKESKIKVINNGIDLNLFDIIESNFRLEKKIDNKKIVLGVAFGWGYKKGLDVFINLSKTIDSDKYQIVLVGTNDKIDKILPENILSIHRTNNQKELAGIYSVADVFVNPTREDTFPTVNLEALACGTPVVTFNTGGSPEAIDDTCGVVIKEDDIATLKKEIIRICEKKPYSSDACRKRAEKFDQEEKYKEYLELYKSLVHGDKK